MNTLLLLCASAIAPAAPVQRLQCGQAMVDRGDIKAGMPLTQTFTLVNRGDAPLVIIDVKGSCGCVKTGVSRKDLQPGDSSELSVELNTISQDAGVNFWTLNVRYQFGPDDQRSTSELSLQIKGNVIREVDVTPVSLFLSIERETQHSITVTDRRSKPLTIDSVHCDSKYVKLQLSAAGANQQGQRTQQVHVTVLDSCPPGHFVESIAMMTNDPDYRELRIPLIVARRVPGAPTATPEQLDLRFARGQKTASGLIRLRTSDEKPVIVERVDADHPAIRYKWAAGPGPMTTLRLTVDLGEKLVSGVGTVKVQLKEPRAQVLLIPVSWQVPPPR
jgi:hypothetical protein